MKTKAAVIYSAILGLLIGWSALEVGLAVQGWFEPAPVGTIKVDAMDEILATARVLNAAIPALIFTLACGVVLSVRRLVPVGIVVAGMALTIALTLGTLKWWTFMDDAHGDSVSLTQHHLWWAR